jgi:hypothetical protein
VNRTVLSAHRDWHDPQRHAALGELLQVLGFRAEEVAGRWRGHTELAWEIAELPSSVALALGRLCGQEAVLANGFLYLLSEPADAGIWARPVLRVDEGTAPPGTVDCTRRGDGRAWHAVLGPATILPAMPGIVAIRPGALV